MITAMETEHTIHFCRGPHGRKILGHKRPQATASPVGRVPRIARLLALAIRLDGLVLSGQVKDYSELARLGHVSRARISQITRLLSLAADIQEEILLLPLTMKGRDKIRERHVRPIAAEMDWKKQRQLWKKQKRLQGISIT